MDVVFLEVQCLFRMCSVILLVHNIADRLTSYNVKMVFNDNSWQLDEIYKVKPIVILFGKHIVLVLPVNVKCMLNRRMSQMLTVALVLLAEIVTFFLVHWSIICPFWSQQMVTGNDVHAQI